MTTLILEAPWPPSINHYWRHTKFGHYISKEGKIYRELIYYMFNKYTHYFKEDERLSVIIQAFPPDRRKRDLDNLLKSTLDALQYAKVYQDDSQIDFLSIERKSSLKGIMNIMIKNQKGASSYSNC